MTFETIMALTPANKENFYALVDAIKKQSIVPFIGAGMAVPFYPLWDNALESLEEKVALDRCDAMKEELKCAMSEIDRCQVLEKHIGKRRICRALCDLFDSTHFTEHQDPRLHEKAVALLPKLFPKSALLTTNLDSMIEEVYRLYNAPFDARLDVTDKNVLPVLCQKRAHGILYLHGHVSGALTDYENVVFSKAQYDQHYQSGSNLVNSMQQWMENAQLLFLGCSLRNDRTLNILEKVFQEHTQLEHFAILDLKADDIDYTSRMTQLEECYGIRSILYPEGRHEAVRLILERLLREINFTAYEEYRNTLSVEPLISNENNTDRFWPEAKNTKLIGREIELRELKNFCNANGDFLWWAITAPGGSGKTRLTMELEETQKRCGWSVNRLNPSKYIESEFLKIEKNCRQPLLVIADYAGENADTLAHWIERLSDYRGPIIRLLLVERESNLLLPDSESRSPNVSSYSESQISQKRKGWYERMKATVNTRTLSEKQYGTSGSFLRLRKLGKKQLTDIMMSYAKNVFMGYILSAPIAEQLYKVLETVDPGLCRPLFAMILVDAYKKTGDPQNWDRMKVLCEIDDRETNHLRKQLMGRLHITNEDQELTEQIQKLRLYSTIMNSVKLYEYPDWQEIKNSLSFYRQKPIDVLRYLHLLDEEQTNDESDLLVVPIKPDLLGEYFVTEHISDALPILFSSGWCSNGRLVSFLDRVIQDYGDSISDTFWKKLLSFEPQNDNEAEAIMNRLFSVTYSTTEEHCNAAIKRMEQIHESYTTAETTYTYSLGLYNHSCDQPYEEKKASIEKVNALIRTNFYSDSRVARVYARGLLNLQNASSDLSEKEVCVKKLKALHEVDAFIHEREIALYYADGLYRLSDSQDLNSRLNTVNELEKLYQSSNGDRDFATTYGKCLYNLFRDQFHTGIQPSMDKLQTLCEEFQNDYYLGFLIDAAKSAFSK